MCFCFSANMHTLLFVYLCNEKYLFGDKWSDAFFGVTSWHTFFILQSISLARFCDKLHSKVPGFCRGFCFSSFKIKKFSFIPTKKKKSRMLFASQTFCNINSLYFHKINTKRRYWSNDEFCKNLFFAFVRIVKYFKKRVYARLGTRTFPIPCADGRFLPRINARKSGKLLLVYRFFHF